MKTKPIREPRRVAGALLALAMLTTGCAYDPAQPLPGWANETLPCEEPVEYLNLGIRRLGSDYRPRVELDGIPVWARLEKVVPRVGILPGDVFEARLYAVPAGEEPMWDDNGDLINEGAVTTRVHVDGFTELTLDGGYFIATSEGAEIELLACEPGAFAEHPDWMASGSGWPRFDR